MRTRAMPARDAQSTAGVRTATSVRAGYASMKRPRCGICKDEGWTEVVIDGVVAAQRCHCELERLEQRRRNRLNGVIPQLFRDVALERNPIASLPTSQRDKIRRYHDQLEKNVDTSRGLWLDGESGVGKSAVAAVLVKRAIALGRSALFCEVPELLNELRRTYRDGAVMDDAVLYREIRHVDLLVLDDLGAAKMNDWVLEQLFIFVNGRYKDEKAIVVTTDLEPGDLRRVIGTRTVRRLREICGKPLTLSFREVATIAA